MAEVVEIYHGGCFVICPHCLWFMDLQFKNPVTETPKPKTLEMYFVVIITLKE